MYNTIKANIETDSKSRNAIGIGYDDDFVSAGKKFLEDKKIKDK